MPHIFAGADRQRIDPEVLEAFKGLPDDFWVFAEFTISRNIDWFIIHPHPDGTLALIVIELKRTTLPLSGDINNLWRQWTPEGWRDLILGGPYRNYYWQAVEAANTLKEWLWNNQRRFRLGFDLLGQDAFKIWPDLLILSPAGVNHQLPLHPPNNFGKFLFAIDECVRHVTTWRTRQLSLVPLVDEELFRLADALGLEQIWPLPGTAAPSGGDLAARVRVLEDRLRQLEDHLGRLTVPHDPRAQGGGAEGIPVEPEPTVQVWGETPHPRGQAPVSEAVAPPTKERVFAWIEEILYQHGPGQPMRLADLGNGLKSRYGLDARLQFGLSLTELLGQLATQGRIRLSHRDRVPFATLDSDARHDDVTVAAAPRTPIVLDVEAGDHLPVRQKLGREGLAAAVQVIATVEDIAGSRVAQTASLLKHLRESLPLNGVPPLSNSEANRLLREELVELEYLRMVTVRDIDLATGNLVTTEGYRLNRGHPAVQILLAMGTPHLHPEIEIRTFAALSEEVPAAG